VLPPKLAAERDKEGHIEYKLKLIDPSPERFGKLVTQMMWRLKQGKNEAIYEIGLAGRSFPPSVSSLTLELTCR
jgi:GTPase